MPLSVTIAARAIRALEHDYAVYVEPNLWVQHRLG
jgi:hypothetical protein